MTDPLDAALAGFAVERWIARSGARGVAIARDDGGRRLVSVLAGSVDDADPGLVDRRPWDLALVDVRPTPGGGTVLVEALPDGDPSTLDPAPWQATPGAVPPFVQALARRVAADDDAGDLSGPLHPALVFVTGSGESGRHGAAGAAHRAGRPTGRPTTAVRDELSHARRGSW